jgi:hypothetical protein
VHEACARAQSRQGTKKNTDEVTDLIGSLIESVVQYAREREPTAQRFVGACNDFLR